MVGNEPLSQPDGGSSYQKLGQYQSGPKYNRRVHIAQTRDIPRASRSGDQESALHGFSLLERDKDYWIQTHHLFFFLKGAKQVFCLQLLTLGPSERRVVQPGVTRGETGVGGTGERVGGAALGFWGPGYT